MRFWTTVLLALLILSPLVASSDHFHEACDISNFVVYYGQDRVNDLVKFDLAILSSLADENLIRELNQRGVITIGYLSLTTVGDWEPWSSHVEPDWIVGELAEWGEVIVNACEPGWREVVMDEAVPYLVRKGFRGLFLDNLDVAEEFPWMSEGLVGLVRTIRSMWPDLFLIQNRGFVILNETASSLNAVLYEDFGTYYNFTTGRYEKMSGPELAELRRTADWLVDLRASYGFTVLALAYADPSDPEMMADYMSFVNSLAGEYGFVPYVSDVNLTYINMAYAKVEESPRPSWGPIFLLLPLLAALVPVFFWIARRRSAPGLPPSGRAVLDG